MLVLYNYDIINVYSIRSEVARVGAVAHFMRMNLRVMESYAQYACGQEHVVWRVRLKTSCERFSMCFECDSVWLDNQLVSEQAGTKFDKLMKSRAGEWHRSGDRRRVPQVLAK